MKIVLFLLPFLLSAAPTPFPWPVAFTINFLSNITTGSKDQTHAIHNTLYYDWNTKKQAVVHGPGAFECAHFYNTTGPCTLLFTATEMYRLLHQPTTKQQQCCIDLTNLGTLPPSWPSKTNATYLGNITDPFSGQSVEEFAWPQDASPMGMHSYLESIATHSPVTFTFPVHDGIQDYHFDTQSQIIGRPNATVFDLPPGCLGTICNK